MLQSTLLSWDPHDFCLRYPTPDTMLWHIVTVGFSEGGVAGHPIPPPLDLSLVHLLYKFDVDDPWKYFSDGIPMESSVERGRKKTSPKHKRSYISKQKNTFTARKNRAHRNIRKICLLCRREQDCLMKGQPHETCLMIQQLRQRLCRRNYKEQNYILQGIWRLKFVPVV